MTLDYGGDFQGNNPLWRRHLNLTQVACVGFHSTRRFGDCLMSVRWAFCVTNSVRPLLSRKQKLRGDYSRAVIAVDICRPEFGGLPRA